MQSSNLNFNINSLLLNSHCLSNYVALFCFAPLTFTSLRVKRRENCLKYYLLASRVMTVSRYSYNNDNIKIDNASVNKTKRNKKRIRRSRGRRWIAKQLHWGKSSLLSMCLLGSKRHFDIVWWNLIYFYRHTVMLIIINIQESIRQNDEYLYRFDWASEEVNRLKLLSLNQKKNLIQ